MNTAVVDETSDLAGADVAGHDSFGDVRGLVERLLRHSDWR